jgi:hypothetical protein
MAFDRQEKAFDFADAAVKQVLTLATGTVGAAVALFDDGETAGIQFPNETLWLSAGFVLTVISIAAGLAAINRLTGVLVEEKVFTSATVKERLVYFFWLVQLLCFPAGLACFVVAAV